MRHVVLCAFRPELTTDEVDAVVAQFADLAATVPSVQSLEHGPNVSPEGLNDGFSHAFTVTFADAAARDEYLVDPVHLAFVEVLKPALARILVVDYLPQ